MAADLHTEHRPGPSLRAVLVCLGLGVLAAIAHYLGAIHWLFGSIKAAAADKPALDYWLFALAPLALYIFRRLAFVGLAIWLLYQGTQLAAAAGIIEANEALWAVVIGSFLVLVAAAPPLTRRQMEEDERDRKRLEQEVQDYAGAQHNQRMAERMSRHL